MVFGFGILKVEQGKALVLSNVLAGTVMVSFTGGLVVPVIHKAEILDITTKEFGIDFSGRQGLLCRDNQRIDVKATFSVRVTRTEEDVIKVAQTIGCVRASEQSTIAQLFTEKFSGAVRAAGRRMESVDFFDHLAEIQESVRALIGDDLIGFHLDSIAISPL